MLPEYFYFFRIEYKATRLQVASNMTNAFTPTIQAPMHARPAPIKFSNLYTILSVLSFFNVSKTKASKIIVTPMPLIHSSILSSILNKYTI